MKILIVDDDAAWIKITTRFFTMGGHQVYSAVNCAGALALADLRSPDCVLIDGSLEDGTAEELCAAIRAREKLSEAVLIVVSGSPQESENSCADRFILKGTQLAGITEAIADVVRTRPSGPNP